MRRLLLCASLAVIVTLAIAYSPSAHAKTDTGLRLTYEALGGLGALAGSAGTALVIASQMRTGGGGRAITGMSALPQGLLVLAAPLFLTPLGIYLAGNAAGANGSYWGALGGATVGALVSVLPMAPLLTRGHYWLALATVSVLGIAGAMIGYELGNHEPATPANALPAAPNARSAWLPVNVLLRF